MAPTEKQIRLVEEMTETLKINFPSSSKRFYKNGVSCIYRRAL